MRGRSLLRADRQPPARLAERVGQLVGLVDRRLRRPGALAEDGDASVVCSIVELAHALGLKVIAEGAEDEATIDRLAELGADFIQGYGVTRPLAPEAFHAWLAEAPSGDWPAWSAGSPTP